MGFQAAARFDAVDAAHHDVKQDQVGLDALRQVDGALARGGEERLVALLQHRRPQRAQVAGLVIDKKHGVLARRRIGDGCGCCRRKGEGHPGGLG